MITKFASLFAGGVDMDDIGLEGTPVNDRSFSDEYLSTALQKTQNIAQLMDRLGYDTLWLAEHHFQPEGYECIPNLLLFSVHLAHLTENIRFGCGFNIAPMWNPLRLAEDYAMADILTGGRVIFGVGRGYHSREVNTFGSPSTQTDNDANRDLFEEQVDIIFKAFNNRSFSHHSKLYDIPPRVPYRGYELEEITLVPRPRTLPVECWQPVVTASQRQMDFMVKHGIKGVMGGGAAPGGASHEVILRWRETLARAGRETQLGGDLQVTYHTFIADTEEKAIAEARPYFEEHMKMFGPLGFLGLTPEQIDAMADPRRPRSGELPTLEQAIDRGWWVCGTPELVTEKLMSFQQAFPGLETVIVGPPAGGVPERVVLEQLERFAKEVMPTFKSQVNDPA
jgi:alkanesulfonate monooxygenase SsuD/methylene tetrahydromethanopterin reductase-like flavin-dependent oxidoreductase (luciferase family)